LRPAQSQIFFAQCSIEAIFSIQELIMTIAKISEITTSSAKSFDDAIEKGIKRASKTIRGIQGAWIQDQKVVINDGKIVEYRVNMKISFIID
jgi:dodecin